MTSVPASLADEMRGRDKVSRPSSHTGLMQVLPGHPLAHPRSRWSRTQHQHPQKPRSRQLVDKDTRLDDGSYI